VVRYREVSNLGNTLVQTYTVHKFDFGFANLTEPLHFDDFAIFKVANESQVIIQDLQLYKAGAGIVITFGPQIRVNYRVQRRSSTSMIYDLVVCSKNNAPEAD
jgi:hypothetical protein